MNFKRREEAPEIRKEGHLKEAHRGQKADIRVTWYIQETASGLRRSEAGTKPNARARSHRTCSQLPS